MLFGENATTASVGGGYANANRRPTAGTPIGGHGNDVGPNDSKLNKWTMPRSSNQEPSNYNGFKTPFSEPFWAPDSFHQDPHFPVGKMDFSAPPELHNRRANPYSNQSNNGMFPPGDSASSGVPPQWGRVEINQATPWDVGAGGGMPPPNPSTHQWNTNAPSAAKWETKGEPLDTPYSNGSRSGNQPYGGGASNNYMSQPQQMMFNEAMNNPLAMPFQPFNPNQNLWMNQGGMEVPFGRNENHRNVSAPFPNQFNAPPMGHHYGPPPMGMMPPGMGHPGMMPLAQGFNRPLQQSHHVNPPPGMMQSSMHRHAQQQPHHHPNIGGTFGVGAGGMPVVGGAGPMHHHPPGMQTENDSVWQDPDGSLKKWQRDTGTALWGDPTKHNEQSIQRWQQFSEEEEQAASRQAQQASAPAAAAVIDSPNSARGGSKPLLGWGDPLPPEEKACKSDSQTGTDAWKVSNEPKEFGMQQRRNTGFEGLHQQQHEWEAPSTSSNMFPISSSLGAAPTIKHQSAPKVSLAEELSAMGLDDIAGNGQSRKPEVVGTSLW